MSLTVDPTSGPTGTTATIRISNSAPNAAVTLYIDSSGGGNSGLNGLTDANGDYTTQQTLSARPGTQFSILADVGSPPQSEGPATFDVT